MRPQEILGMVEEAAGTRMFEDKKDKARKTMGKKEKRVKDITALCACMLTLRCLQVARRCILQLIVASRISLCYRKIY